jgi:hypothetical protein
MTTPIPNREAEAKLRACQAWADELHRQLSDLEDVADGPYRHHVKVARSNAEGVSSAILSALWTLGRGKA